MCISIFFKLKNDRNTFNPCYIQNRGYSLYTQNGLRVFSLSKDVLTFSSERPFELPLTLRNPGLNVKSASAWERVCRLWPKDSNLKMSQPRIHSTPTAVVDESCLRAPFPPRAPSCHLAAIRLMGLMGINGTGNLVAGRTKFSMFSTKSSFRETFAPRRS